MSERAEEKIDIELRVSPAGGGPFTLAGASAGDVAPVLWILGAALAGIIGDLASGLFKGGVKRLVAGGGQDRGELPMYTSDGVRLSSIKAEAWGKLVKLAIIAECHRRGIRAPEFKDLCVVGWESVGTGEQCDQRAAVISRTDDSFHAYVSIPERDLKDLRPFRAVHIRQAAE